MHRGYIKLFRKIKDSDVWADDRTFSRAEAWIDMLMEAHHDEKNPKRMLIKNKVHLVGYGQILWSVRFMAERWKWSKSSVSRFLELLKKRDSIRTESGTDLTPITIVNYSLYHQCGSKSRDSSGTDCGTDLGQIWDKKKKDKKAKKEEQILSASGDAGHAEEPPFYLTKKQRKLTGKRLETFLEFWDAFAYKRGRAEAADAWLDIPPMKNGTFQQILEAARAEAAAREGMIANGQTPKMAQGWLSGKRWEDEDGPPIVSVPKEPEKPDYYDGYPRG